MRTLVLLAAASVAGLVASCRTLPAPVASIGAEALQGHVQFLAGLDPPRSATHPESLDRAAAYIAHALQAAGGRVEEQIFQVGGEDYRNVRAFFGPRRGPRLVIGAHYDVAGDMPGADDNASGVAVLVSLASRLAETELTLPVELVAYTLEEPPHYDTSDMGSVRHARALRAEGVELVGMISLEMLGFYSDEPGSQDFPLEGLEERFGNVGDFLAVVGRPADEALVERTHVAMQGASELAIEKLLAPRRLTGVDFSDHRSYWDADYTAVMITDTAFFRNPHYHEGTDTAETLDYERMAMAEEALYAAALDLAADGR